MKKRIIFIILMVLLTCVLSSCKKVTSCRLKRNNDFYIVNKYLENKEYVDYLTESVRERISFIKWEEINLEFDKFSSCKKNYAFIGSVLGHLVETKNYTVRDFYNSMIDSLGFYDLFEWNYYFAGNFYATKDIISYSILYGEPIIYNNLLCYNNFYHDNHTYLAGINYNIENLSSINDLIIPEDTSYILGCSFFENNYLKSIICNENLEYIGHMAFVYNSSLHYVKFNEKLKGIGQAAFYACPLDYIVIPESVIEIGENAFADGNIFCEVESKPKGWDDNWAVHYAKVYWKGEWEYNFAGIPMPKAK